MKQLKFMLAAATAVGIAAVVQAGEKTTYLVGTAADAPENFESAELAGQNPVGAIAGYDFQPTAPATAADNESLIKDGALNVNTGTDPLLRALDWSVTGNSANSVALTADKSLYIDTMVQFTVTPVGDSVTATAGDKLMIYLQEVPEVKEGDEVVSAATTKLMVKAAQLKTEKQGLQVVEKYVATETVVDNYQVEAGEWYHLKVNAFVDAKGKLMFKISIKDADDTTFTELLSNEGDPLVANDRTLFPSLQEASEASVAVKQALTHVGFAGEGKVDDLLVWTVEPQTSVDFTLALGDGVSAVSWTVNEEQQDTKGGTFTADSGTTLTVAINSVTYAAGYAGTQDWTTYTYAKAESGSVEITAKKFADVAADGTATPIPATIEAAATGAFACPELGAADYAVAVEKLGKAVTWATSVAKKSYDDAMACINRMNFANVTTNNVEEAAYLFNCEPTPAAIAAEAAAFKFPSFTKDMTIDAMRAAVEADKDYNGTVEIHGATTLEAGDWAKDKQGAFYKAVLTK